MKHKGIVLISLNSTLMSHDPKKKKEANTVQNHVNISKPFIYDIHFLLVSSRKTLLNG